MSYLLVLASIAICAALAAAAVALSLRPIRAARAAERLARSQRDFHRQRERLEARFIERAAATGKPRGLRWADVDFDDDVIYARDRRNLAPAATVKYLASDLELVAEEPAAPRA